MPGRSRPQSSAAAWKACSRVRSDADQLTGILNGIDESWDPRHCAQLAQPFGSGDWKGKQANADYVRRQFGLAVSRGPIFGLVARLVHQKGVDLVLSAADEIVRDGGQIVVTGSGEPAIEDALVAAHRRRPDAIGVIIGFNDGQARRIFAGSDFTLMPSRFEPCGLSQMYAQRFGSLPIGHQTGGLAETIADGETGFLFAQPSAESFLGGVRRAFDAYRAKDRLNAMRSSAMAKSYSWDLSAACYGALYKRLIMPRVMA
ncbi:ADP-glucose type glycogen/starch synthase [Bradyrhizobium sp. USDA 4522]